MQPDHYVTISLISLAYILLYYILRVSKGNPETFSYMEGLTNLKENALLVSIGTLIIPIVISVISTFIFDFFKGATITEKVFSGVHYSNENGTNARLISILWLLISLTIFYLKYDRKERNQLCSSILFIMIVFVIIFNFFFYLEDTVIPY